MAFEYIDGKEITAQEVLSHLISIGAAAAAKGIIPGGFSGGLTVTPLAIDAICTELFGAGDEAKESVKVSYGEYGMAVLRALKAHTEDYRAFLDRDATELDEQKKDECVGASVLGMMVVLSTCASVLFDEVEKTEPEKEESNADPANE